MESIWLKNYPPKVPAEIDLRYSSIIHKFEESISPFKDQVAFENFGVQMSFDEWDLKSTHFASYLSHYCNLKKGDALAIQIPNTLQYPIAVIGALKAGLVVVNINPLYTSRELGQILSDSKAKAILVFSHSVHNLKSIQHETNLEHVIVTHLGDLFPRLKRYFYYFILRFIKKMIKASPSSSVHFNKCLKQGSQIPFKNVATTRDDLAFLQYTGGTTGVPKGAMLTHYSVLSNIEQCHVWITPYLNKGQEVSMVALPLYHIFALTINLFVIPLFGAHSVLVTNPRDINHFTDLFKKYKRSMFVGVNALFKLLLRNPEFKDIDFSSLKLCIAGGASVESSVYNEWLEVTKKPIVEGYGLTEASPVVCCNNYYSPKKGYCGLPLPSTLVRIIGDQGEESEVGELQVKGPQLMRGYWNRPKETQNVFTPDGWLKTGDIARMDSDGAVQILDRKKDMILVSGFNVYPNNIEDILSLHPQIEDAAVIGVPDEISGEVPKAFIVRKDTKLTESEVLNYCRKNLVAYKVPKYIEFRNSLPHSNVGKVLRKDLRKNEN